MGFPTFRSRIPAQANVDRCLEMSARLVTSAKRRVKGVVMTEMTSSTSVNLRPVTALVGAEVHGVDLREPLDRSTSELLQQALLDHGVLFFHGQVLTREEFHSFLGIFGEPMVDPYSAL